LIIGATSAIAEATARAMAERGSAFFLVGRSIPRLTVIAQDLKVRGASQVDVQALDANDLTAHGAVLERAEQRLAHLDTAIVAYGHLSDQQACEQSAMLTVQELMTNAVSVAALLTRMAERFAVRRHGTIVVISSVAGERGRQSNYVYGSAKALVSTFLSGLRQRLHAANVRVITVKPGLVDTPMTESSRKGWLWAKPDVIAYGIVAAIDRSRSTVYLPGFWRPVMWAIRALPEPILRRLHI
jgi:decaprenylphospho-beta-D-erythro-pentofuranosid-2-ulose 2-reductase